MKYNIFRVNEGYGFIFVVCNISNEILSFYFAGCYLIAIVFFIVRKLHAIVKFFVTYLISSTIQSIKFSCFSFFFYLTVPFKLSNILVIFLQILFIFIHHCLTHSRRCIKRQDTKMSEAYHACILRTISPNEQHIFYQSVFDH